jgi:transposase
LTELGAAWAVIAPTLTPTKAGDRVKTNRREAEKLARCHRAGDLTPVGVPEAAHEALRDLVRDREDAKQDQQRARQRLGKFRLRHGWQRPKDIQESWTQKHRAWIKSQVHFQQTASQAAFLDYVHEVEHAAGRLQRIEKAIDAAIAAAPAEIQQVVQGLPALRGVGKLVAVTAVAELGSLSRFPNPRKLMGYSGMVSSEYSTGKHVQRGGITKIGNAYLRRVIVEAAWAYQHKPWIGGWLAQRQQGLDEETKAIAWKAQWRLCTRYKKLAARGKEKPEIVTAIGRELLGFIWAIAVRIEAGAAAPRT